MGPCVRVLTGSYEMSHAHVLELGDLWGVGSAEGMTLWVGLGTVLLESEGGVTFVRPAYGVYQ